MPQGTIVGINGTVISDAHSFSTGPARIAYFSDDQTDSTWDSSATLTLQEKIMGAWRDHLDDGGDPVIITHNLSRNHAFYAGDVIRFVLVATGAITIDYKIVSG